MKTHNWQTKALTLFIAAAALWIATACNGGMTNETSPPTETIQASFTGVTAIPTKTPTREATETTTKEVTAIPTEAPAQEATEAPIEVPTEVPTKEAIQAPTKEATEAPTKEPTEVPTKAPTKEASEVPTQAPTKEATETPTVENSGQPGRCTTESPELTSRLNTSEEEYQEHRENSRRADGVLEEYEALFWRQPNVYDVSDGFLRDGKGGWTDMWGITVWVTEKVDQSTLPHENQIPDSLNDVQIQIVQAKPLPQLNETSCDYSMCGMNLEEGRETIANTTENTSERRHEVRLKYDPLFWRQPYVRGVSEGRLKDGRGGWLRTRGINVIVTTKVNQSTLPPEDRIPDCLEGIPVKITEDTTKYVIIGS